MFQQVFSYTDYEIKLNISCQLKRANNVNRQLKCLLLDTFRNNECSLCTSSTLSKIFRRNLKKKHKKKKKIYFIHGNNIMWSVRIYVLSWDSMYWKSECLAPLRFAAVQHCRVVISYYTLLSGKLQNHRVNNSPWK